MKFGRTLFNPHPEDLILHTFCRCPHSSPVEAAPMSRAQNLNSWDSVYDGYKFTMTTAANESSPTLQIPEKIDEYRKIDAYYQYWQIVNEICTAVLHVNSTIIHEDIKPGNILLNINMVPRISDFGISNLLMEEEQTRTKESYIGTLGYMTPEYIYNNLNKFYMFSLGVIMMEILTGPTGYSNNPEMSSQHFTQIMKIIIEIGLSFVGIIEYVFLIPFVHDILVLRNSGASLSAEVDKINLLLDSDGKALAARPSMHQRHFFRSNLADERSDKPRSNGVPATNSSEETTHAPMGNKLTDDETENHSDPNSCVIERDSNEKEKRSAEWYIATGAAHHATWKRDLFSNMVDVENDGRCVHAADGTPMPVCGRGDVVTDDVILPDVYYVPGLCTNLVSVAQLAGLDYCVGFGRGACVISNAAGAVVGRAHARGDGLYEVDFLRIPLSEA